MLAFLSDHLSVVGLPPLFHNYLTTIAFIAIVYAAFFVVERLRPVERIDWSSIWLNLRLALVLQIAIMVLAAWLQPALLSGVSGWLPGGSGLIKTGSIAQQSLLFVAYLLVYDFLYYWLHRAQHRYDALWAIHKLHHTETHVNVTTTLRVHWLEEVLKALIIIFPVSLLFDAPPVAQGWLAGILGVWLFFVHANLRVSFGPLSWLLTSPAAHRIHHSLDRRQSNSNFAVIFPIWDIVFGTYTRPAANQWPKTGVAGEATPGFWGANVDPLARIADLSLKRKQISPGS
jgi:sterol desaturase/sphingolipid hydroxylase (fatty acid hydroxylase superfamily)